MIISGNHINFAPTRRDIVNARLVEIDAATTKPRTTRELQLGNAATAAWVKIMDDEAVLLRAELLTLPI